MATSGASVTERTYMNSQTGSRLRLSIAQNGIFWRDFAAATYGGSGFGGGGGAAAAAALRPTGPLGGAAAAGAAAAVVAGVAAAGASPPAAGRVVAPEAEHAARRSRDRFSRCSGISVTRRHDRRRPAARTNSACVPSSRVRVRPGQ